MSKFIGDRKFYRMVLTVTVPIIIQNGITNFVNLLDNLMVGSLGTEPMSGVSIVNQLMFVFNLLIFGALAAAGIFMSQFHGKGDDEGERDTFRLKFILVILAALGGIAVFRFGGTALIESFLHEGETKGDLALTLALGQEYLAVMLLGLLPYAVAQIYASSLRETGHTVVPMLASLAAVVVNCGLNAVLIFGLFGAPALGVKGAAVATVVARCVELFVVVLYTHLCRRQHGFIRGAYRSLRIPRSLIRQIVAKGLPLMANEVFWAAAVTMTSRCYSLRGLEVIAASNIASTVSQFFNIVYMSLGAAISIVVGNLLGAGHLEEAEDTDRKMIAFSVLCSVAIGALLAALAPLFPQLYNTTEDARALATFMIRVFGLLMPFCAFANAAYFTLRSGGRVLITFVFDSVFMWALAVPVAFLLTEYTSLSIYWIFPIVQGLEILKCGLGFGMLRQRTWIRRLVVDDTAIAEEPSA